MTARQATRRSSARSRRTVDRSECESALDNVSFYFRVLRDRYIDCLKSELRRHELDGIVKPGFGLVLFSLFEVDVLRPSEIASRIGIKPTALTAIIDQMVERGLVQRVSDENDRRAIGLRLLPKGQEIRRACYQVLDATTATICQDISEKDLTATKRVLRQMIRNMGSSE